MANVTTATNIKKEVVELNKNPKILGLGIPGIPKGPRVNSRFKNKE